jgi:hypothetical protein
MQNKSRIAFSSFCIIGAEHQQNNLRLSCWHPDPTEVGADCSYLRFHTTYYILYGGKIKAQSSNYDKIKNINYLL